MLQLDLICKYLGKMNIRDTVMITITIIQKSNQAFLLLYTRTLQIVYLKREIISDGAVIVS